MSVSVTATIVFAGIVWGARQWLTPAVIILLIAACALAWGYARLRGPLWLRVTTCSFKAIALLLLTAILLDPLWSSSRARPGENVVLVLVDTSQSMNVQGKDHAISPGDAFHDRLYDEREPWLVRLKQDFDLRRYSFDSRLEPRTDFATLEFDGRSSSLYHSLKSLQQRFAGRPVAGIVLFTDGVATDQQLLDKMDALPPIFPVLPPPSEPAAEVTLSHVAVTQTNFEDAPVSIVADAHVTGFKKEPLVCEVLDEADKVVQTQELVPNERDGTAAFRFRFRPAKEGLSFYRVRVAAKSQHEVWTKPETTTEATLANNQRLVMIDRGHGPYRILYVGGSPNPEHKFLGRAVSEDAEVELVSLVRIARREPKFDFRTRTGESSNPLFRGFGKTDDDTERYDQPVFIRIGIKNESELRDGFPKTADQLFKYHAVILDDVEAGLFTTDQMTLLSRFVSERGGGLLMLGGPDSFEKGNFAKTPIADVLPVYLQRTTATRPANPQGYRWQLTREGWLEPWMRLRASEPDEMQRLESMPPLRTLNHVSGIKPGASLLATAVDPQGTQQPAFVVQPYGRGRAAALLIGDLWRWRLKMEPENQDLEKMWRQTIRWLAADVGGRVVVSNERTNDDLTQAIKLQIRVRDADYQPLDNAQATIQVTPPDGRPLTLEAEPSRREPGVYEASYVPRSSGAYRASAKVVDGSGTELGAMETGWTNDTASEEFRSLVPARDELRDLAKRSGGETVELKDLETFAAGLAARPAPETVQTLFPLWHTPWIFALAIACLAGEWGLRRWKGLP